MKPAVVAMARQSGWCFEQYRVEWLGSLLSADGRSMVCRFRGGDAESIRQALTAIDADMRRLWQATTHEVENPGAANVLVERSFAAPTELEALQARENAAQWCLDTYNVEFVRTFFSSDRRRMLCLYSGPDAESVKAAQLQAEMPLERVWPFASVGMADVLD